MALINVFQAENHCIIEIGLEGTGKD